MCKTEAGFLRVQIVLVIISRPTGKSRGCSLAGRGGGCPGGSICRRPVPKPELRPKSSALLQRLGKSLQTTSFKFSLLLFHSKAYNFTWWSADGGIITHLAVYQVMQCSFYNSQSLLYHHAFFVQNNCDILAISAQHGLYEYLVLSDVSIAHRPPCVLHSFLKVGTSDARHRVHLCLCLHCIGVLSLSLFPLNVALNVFSAQDLQSFQILTQPAMVCQYACMNLHTICSHKHRLWTSHRPSTCTLFRESTQMPATFPRL